MTEFSNLAKVMIIVITWFFGASGSFISPRVCSIPPGSTDSTLASARALSVLPGGIEHTLGLLKLPPARKNHVIVILYRSQVILAMPCWQNGTERCPRARACVGPALAVLNTPSNQMWHWCHLWHHSNPMTSHTIKHGGIIIFFQNRKSWSSYEKS